MTRDLFAELDAAGIAYTLHEHAPVFTVDESAHLHAQIPGAHTKNLFLRDDKDRYWLVTIPAEVRADLKHVQRQIGSGRLSFGKPAAMERLLGITPGSVTPLAAINDTDGMVTVVLDAAFASDAPINVHPLRNSATVSLKRDDLIALLRRWDRPPLIVALS